MHANPTMSKLLLRFGAKQGPLMPGIPARGIRLRMRTSPGRAFIPLRKKALFIAAHPQYTAGVNPGDITVILQRIERGDEQAAERLLPLVYEQLRQLAAARMAHEAPGHTLQPTALVHEAWLRLGGDQQPDWKNRAHFFAAAAEAMRRILIDSARRRLAQRRGGRQEHVNIDEIDVAAATDDARMLKVNDALEKLALHNAEKAELVKLRYFANFTLEEAAAALNIAEPTARRWWAYARAWLLKEMSTPGG
jgi:RNA polymerase sigma factor (TIGR02999 family)